MNKKGIVFTFIVVSLLSVVLIAFLINVSNKNTQAKIQETTVNVETLNSFTKSLDEQVIPQALEVSSNRAILSWLYYLDLQNEITPNTFITATPNLNTNLKNAIVYEKYVLNVGIGKGSTVQLNFMYDDGANYTLPSVFKEIENLAINSGVNFSYDSPNNYVFTINQISPWEINVSMIMTDYKVSDLNGDTFWEFKNKPYSVILNVTNFIDPLALVYNNRSVTINRTRSSLPFDSAGLQSFYERPEFVEDSLNNDAPSFLDRLQGTLTPNVNGIESILDPLYFENLDLNSNVDFLYYNYYKKGNSLITGCLVSNTNVYLDSGHYIYYTGQACNQNN